MVYLYLDESGDLGFDFVNKKPSRFFTVCIVVIKGRKSRDRIARMVKRTLRKKLNPKNRRKRMVQELKATSTTLKVKEYFYHKVKNEKFSIYALTLNKKRVYSRLVKDKSRVYNWIARLLTDEIDFSLANMRIEFVVGKSKSKPEIIEFNKYVKAFVEGRVDPQIPFVIRHEDSKKDLCLNMADLFAWGIFRKYERRDHRWYNVFKDKVKFDDVYLR